ncbi:MAG: hypothetical protein SAJ12_09320 [Jaaginema sp. PMC 1079.18]|nr:hypothetical protein [Jaaginema sp. PMC 1080.18]MEC4851200.1 hypothetical protein [Jaaginema sp. PMC 1079.18]MEC4864781.1 hypothetical protein [Jaaginema sp. PMC 1078.18]
MKYKVLSRLIHNDKEYLPDSTVELTDDEAKTLTVLHVVEAVEPTKPSEPKAK